MINRYKYRIKTLDCEMMTKTKEYQHYKLYITTLYIKKHVILLIDSTNES